MRPIHLPKEERSTGIVLTGEDLLVLTQIYLHFNMRAPSIHENGKNSLKIKVLFLQVYLQSE